MRCISIALHGDNVWLKISRIEVRSRIGPGAGLHGAEKNAQPMARFAGRILVLKERLWAFCTLAGKAAQECSGRASDHAKYRPSFCAALCSSDAVGSTDHRADGTINGTGDVAGGDLRGVTAGDR